jgi:hypothetical protein
MFDENRTPARLLNLEAALSYAARRWPVFPLHTPRSAGCSCGDPDCEHVGKHPRTQRGFHDATTEEAAIRRWWTEWPDANIGVATGAACGIVVLDIDPRHGGDETLAEWEREHGSLPNTVEALTGGGGRHIYLAHPGGDVKSRNVGPGGDVKADGGYIVAPPSLHASGRQYEWEASSHPDETPLAPLPEWLSVMVTSPPAERRAAPADAPAALRAGARNIALTSLAGAMRRAGMQQMEILAGLREVNRRRCRPPLPGREVEGIARGITRYAPSSLSSLLYRASDGDDDLNAAPVELRTLAKPGPRQWVVEGLLPARKTTVLYGDGGLAKSLLAMLLGDCVARGQDLFGRPVQQGPVLFLDWELDQEEQTRRAHQIAAGLGHSTPAPGLYYRQMVSLLSGALPQIRAWAEEFQITVAVIDSFGLATLGDPTTARDVVPLLAGASKLPCTCLFIDHVRNLQAGETGDDLKPFGSVYKFNIARSVIRVARAGGDEVSLSLVVRQTKSNFGPLSEPLGLRVTFEEERICFEQMAASSPGLARAARHPGGLEKVSQELSRLGEASPQQLAEAVELSVGTVKNKLTELRRSGLAAPIARGLWRPIEPSSSLSLSLSSGDDGDVAAAGGQ